SGELIAKTFQLFRKFVEVRRDKVIIDSVETFEPKRGDLIEDRALVWNRIGQNHIEGREPIGHDEEKRLAEIENFADFPAAEFFDSRKIDNRLWRGLHSKTLNAQRSTFNVQFRGSLCVERRTLKVQ